MIAWHSGPLMSLGTAAGYVLSTRLVGWVGDHFEVGAALWPAAGLTTALLLMLPTRRWGWVLAGVVVAESGLNAAYGQPWSASVWWTAGNVVAPAVGASLMRRFGNSADRLVSLRNLGVFVVTAVLIGPMVGATVGSIGTVLATDRSLWQIWPAYVASDALGVLLIAPLLLTLRQRTRWQRRRIETIALGAALAGAVWLVFIDSGGWAATLPYPVIVVLTWGALRYGIRGAAAALSIAAVTAVVMTADGAGPFAALTSTPTHAILRLQGFFFVVGTCVLLLAASVEELSSHEEVARVLRRQSQRDRLTGLANRAGLAVAIDQALAGNPDRELALVVVDLDGFKLVNDGLGHDAGDHVLVAVAHRLRAHVNTSDTVARLSGDEFVVLLADTDMRVAATVADRLLNVLDEPVTLADGSCVTPAGSIGYCTTANADDPASLLRNADIALYHAKRQGRGRAEAFDDQLRDEAVERLMIQRDLPAALANGDLRCVYQPEIDLVTGTVFSLEALVRWHHPHCGLLSPARFVPIAEAAGHASILFDSVLAETLATQQRWTSHLGHRPAVSVNLSAHQLHDTALPGRVATALAAAGAPASSLWLEVTETAVAHAQSSAVLADLHALGVGLAIDDFGTGWSSLQRLAEFPWDLLKVDRTFIANLDADSMTVHMVEAIVALAHTMDIRVVAEGVETTRQLQLLTAVGCDIAQGYLFAKPGPSETITADIATEGTWTGPHADSIARIQDVGTPR